MTGDDFGLRFQFSQCLNNAVSDRAELLDGGRVMSIRYAVFLLSVLSLGVSVVRALEPPVELDWWASRTNQVCMAEESIPGVGVFTRLQNCTTGFVDGTVALPHDDTWQISFFVQPDEDVSRDPTDFVDVFINGAFVERILNDPAAFLHEVTSTVSGTSFSYRFEFTSSNSTFHLHEAVWRGRAVPGVPLRWWSAQTNAACVFQLPINDTQRVRLDACSSGFAEGIITLPSAGPWDLFLFTQADEDLARDPTDSIDLFINGNLVKRVVNDPAAFVETNIATITVSTVNYRFEFTSSNANHGLHQSVEIGYARPSTSAVPATSDWGLVVMTLLVLATGTLLLRKRDPLAL